MDPTVTLTVSEPTGVRRVGACSLHIVDEAAAARLALRRVVELRVTDFVRGALPAGERVASLRVVVTDPTHVLEFGRFAKYLLHGLDGRSAPKAAAVRAPPGVRLFLQPPTGGSADAALDLVAVATAEEPVIVAPVLPPPPLEQAPAAAAANAAPASSTSAPQASPTAVVEPTPPPSVAATPSPQPQPTTFPLSHDGHGREFVPRAQVAAALQASRAATDALIDTVTGWIVDGAISFPYKRNYTTLAQAEAHFARVRGMPPPRQGLLRCERYPLHGYQPLMGEPHAAALGSGGGAPIECTVDSGVVRGAAPAAPVSLLPPQRVSLPPAQMLFVLGVAPAFLPWDPAINEAGGILVDYFSEPARMAARRRDQPVRSDAMWRQPDIARRVVEKALRKFRELTDASLRRGTYGHVPGVNLFHANLAATIYALLGGTRVLDPCAGWGDRLMGALARDDVVLYRGFDPNPLLVAPHAEMVATFGPRRGAGTSFAVGCVPWEDADVAASLAGTPFAGDATPFDCVLTSPPYFDLELYNEAPSASTTAVADGAPPPAGGDGGLETQSVARHGGNLATWLTQWYFPMLAKAWGLLAPGGHMAIYINDHVPKPGVPGEPLLICEPMLRYVAASLPDAVWVGCVGVEGETGSIRPLWVWRKGAPPAGQPLPPLYAIMAAAPPVAAQQQPQPLQPPSGGYSATPEWRAPVKRPRPEQQQQSAAADGGGDPAVQAWLAACFRIIDAGDDAGAMSALVRQAPSTGDPASPRPVDAQDGGSRDHLTLLMRAAKAHRERCVGALLGQLGADVNAVAARSGYTALSLAVYAHQPGNPASQRVIDALLAAGADPTLLNKYGESAVRVAEARGHPALAARLRAHAEARGFGVAGALRAAPTPAVTLPLTQQAAASSPLALTVRPVQPGDQAAVTALYRACQQGYMGDAATAPAHEAFLMGVLTTDLRDVAGHYGSLPRGTFWVATLPADAAAGALKGGSGGGGSGGDDAGATSGTPAAPSTGGSGGLLIPRKRAPPAAEPAVKPYATDGGAAVIVGCVAIVPAVALPGEGEGGAAAEAAASSSASAALTADPRTTRVCELQRMCVHPGLRRCGLASALLAHAEAWAAGSGYATVTLSTLASMAPAVALYRRGGYAQAGPPGGVPKAYHGAVIHVVRFDKALPQPAQLQPLPSAAASDGPPASDGASSAPAAQVLPFASRAVPGGGFSSSGGASAGAGAGGDELSLDDI